jgi:hypothetical protein
VDLARSQDALRHELLEILNFLLQKRDYLELAWLIPVNALRNSFPRKRFLSRLLNCEKGLSASLHSLNVRLPFLLCRLDPSSLAVDFLLQLKNSTL